MLKAITRKQAYEIARRCGVSISADDGRTYYATNENETEVWEFNTKRERDKALTKG